MYKIIDNRGTGKTTQLICLAKQYNATIVASSPNYIFRKCKELGFEKPVEVISYNDFIALRYFKSKDHYYLIDDMSSFLRNLCPGIIGYTDSLEYRINGKLAAIIKE